MSRSSFTRVSFSERNSAKYSERGSLSKRGSSSSFTEIIRDAEQEKALEKRKGDRRARQRKSIGAFVVVDLGSPSIFENCDSPVEKLDLIMSKAKESGKSYEAIFNEFRHENGEINFEDFEIGLKKLIKEQTADPDDTATKEFRVMFDYLDENQSNGVDLKEFQEYALKMKNVSWKAERIRQSNNFPGSPLNKAQVNPATFSNDEIKTKTCVVEKHHNDTITEVYHGPKFFWRSQTKLELVFTQYEITNCIVVTAFHEKLQVNLDPIFLKSDQIMLVAARSEADHESVSPSKNNSKLESEDGERKAEYLSTCILARLGIEDDEESKTSTLNFRDRELLAYETNPGVEKFVYPVPKEDNLAKFNDAKKLQQEGIERVRRSSVHLEEIMKQTRDSISAFSSLVDPNNSLKDLSPTQQKLARWAQGIHIMQIRKLLVKYGYDVDDT